jgi:hypothetical protein
MHLSKVNEALDHKINGGSEYGWNCWPNARWLDYESDNAHASVVFNSETQEVYVAEVNDKNDVLKPYRWMNPFYKDQYLKEAEDRNIDPNQAWDNKKWYDLETHEDWLTKARAIMRGEMFDERVEVPLELEDDVFMQLALEAHKRDITINKMVELILQKVIDERLSMA